VQVQVLRKNGTTSAVPKGLQVNLVDPGVVTAAETTADGSDIDPAAFIADGTPDPTSSSSTDSATPSNGTTVSPAQADPTPTVTATESSSTSPPTSPPSNNALGAAIHRA
jgi:hypothetical protein